MVSLDIATVPSIVILCYLFATIAKNTFVNTDKERRLLPSMCGVFGGIVSILLYFFIPTELDGYTFFTAFTTGIASGFASTGLNQLYKQMSMTFFDDSDDATSGTDDTTTITTTSSYGEDTDPTAV